MTRRFVLPTVMLLGLVAGCGSSGSNSTGSSGEETPADVGPATCEEFYEGTGTPLVDRAEDAREALTAGDVADRTSYSEVNLLDQRLTELGDDAPDELSTLLDEIRAPFTEAVTEYNVTMADADDEDAEFPDFSTIDTDSSATAQEEFSSACSNAGFDS